MEFILDGIIYLIVSFMDNVLPVLNLPDAFVANIDNATAYMIGLLNSAGYFVPLGVLSSCFTALVTVDLVTLTIKCVKWVVSIIRG